MREENKKGWDGIEHRKNFVCPAHCAMISNIEETHKAIYGNGDITKGLYWMTERNTEFIKTVKRIFWPCLITALMGAISAFCNFLINVHNHLLK
jgi:hypothetical protein